MSLLSNGELYECEGLGETNPSVVFGDYSPNESLDKIAPLQRVYPMVGSALQGRPMDNMAGLLPREYSDMDHFDKFPEDPEDLESRVRAAIVMVQYLVDIAIGLDHCEGVMERETLNVVGMAIKRVLETADAETVEVLRGMRSPEEVSDETKTEVTRIIDFVFSG